MLAPTPLLRRICLDVCTSSIAIFRLLCGSPYVLLLRLVVRDLLLLFLTPMFRALSPDCSLSCCGFQVALWCSRLVVRFRSDLPCWKCCVQERTRCCRESMFLLVVTVGVVVFARRVCPQSVADLGTEGRLRRLVRSSLLLLSCRCSALRRCVVVQVAVVHLQDVSAMRLGCCGVRRSLC